MTDAWEQKMIADNLEINFTYEGNCKIALTLKNKPTLKQLEDLKNHVDNGKLLDVAIKKYRKKRSLDANAYMWIILQKISEKVNSSKEEIYREIIKRVGRFEITPIKNEAVDRWIKDWNDKGIAWHSEPLRSKLDGYTTTINYYGTSTYNTKEMSIVINEVVFEAKELGIETMAPQELELLLNYK